MNRTVVIHQPDFAPHLGFFHRFLHADLYVALDHVQFVQHTARSWMNRDCIKTPSGVKWLTVSVRKTPRGTPINAVRVSTEIDWRTDNLSQIEANYAKAAHFAEVYPEIKRLYSNRADRLAEFNLAVLEWLMEALGVRLPIVLSSSLDPQGRKNEMLADILRKVGATTYLSGVGARDYYHPAPYAAAGVRVDWQAFRHPVYPQINGDFVAGLSAFDLLLNCGIERSQKILEGSR